MRESYSCELCKASMSESSFIENQGMCSDCFEKFLEEQKELADIERWILRNVGVT